MSPKTADKSSVLPLIAPLHMKKGKLRAVCQCATFLSLVIGYSAFNVVLNKFRDIEISSQTAVNPPNGGGSNIRRRMSEKSELQTDRNLSSLYEVIEKAPSSDMYKARLIARFSEDKVIPPFNRAYANKFAEGRLVEEVSGEDLTTNDNDEKEEEEKQVADPKWMLVFYILGVLYMFVALAVVVDEFFVPSLEEISSPRQLGLSMDVAGATLMAAGGSAPELFTSVIATFEETDLGFGTIVGSAVFNVLFVIGMCSLLSKDVLTLTWWPLFRDCTYYSFGLIVLACFVGVVSKGEIVVWEAWILFGLYFGYVLVMKFNQQLFKLITGKDFADAMGEKAKPESALFVSNDEVNQNVDGSSAACLSTQTVRDFRWQGTFRTGVLKLLRNPSCWVDTGGVGIVSKISGDVDATWKAVDKDNDGFVSKDELRTLFDELDCPLTDEQLDEVLMQLDEDKDGKVNEAEFTKWYIKSEERIRSRIQHIFDMIDDDKSGTIDKDEVRNLLFKLEPRVSEDDVTTAFGEMYQEGDTDEITFQEFSDWYLKSMFYERQTKDVDEAMVGIFENFKPPCDEGIIPVISWLVVLPLIITLSLTIPDVRRVGWHKFCYLSFIISIVWVGVYSYLMVMWAEIVGNTLGIPTFIMGMVVLAAGTSVPDLLSSVIVARRGEGDMAVSSSIGSNIFDILVGLPLPWILFISIKKKNITIAADGVWRSILILLGMVVLIIATIHLSGWKLTKGVGFTMFILYFAFLAQAIYTELPFDTTND